MKIDIERVLGVFGVQHPPHDVQQNMLKTLIAIINELGEDSDPGERIVYLYAGMRKGNTTLWKALQTAYPEQVVLVASTKEMARALGCQYSIRQVQAELLDLKDKVIIYDLGGALYASSPTNSLSAGQAVKFVDRAKLRALVIS